MSGPDQQFRYLFREVCGEAGRSGQHSAPRAASTAPAQSLLFRRKVNCFNLTLLLPELSILSTTKIERYSQCTLYKCYYLPPDTFV